ncbi:OmcA/MtrC family decaheme c-type cytochrome [Ferrimonas gelatinilytica]
MKTLTQLSPWRSLLLAGIASFALVACSDGDDGADGPAGPPGEVNIGINDAKSLNATITEVSIDEAGTVAVDFTLTNANGVAITGLEQPDSVDRIGMGIAKLTSLQKRARPLPGDGADPAEDDDVSAQKGTKALQWTSYINRLVEPGTVNLGEVVPPEGWDDNKGTQIQAGIETGCGSDCVEATGNGTYRYTFSMPLEEYSAIEGLDTSYNPDLTHRVTMELRRVRGDVKEALVNTFYDFVPATGMAASPEETRNLVVLEQSCLRCHSNDYDNASAHPLILHGGARFEIENCSVCHTTYSGDPETGATIDFGSMLHQIHKAEYFMIGFGGNPQDFRELTFPANGNDCKVCHLDGEEGAPLQAENWHYHRQEACLSCHEKFAPEDWAGTARDLFHRPSFPPFAEGNCGACHAGDEYNGEANDAGSSIFHLARTNATANAREAYAYTLSNGTYDAVAGTLSFTLSWTTGTAPESDPNVSAFWVSAAAFNGTEYSLGNARATTGSANFGRNRSRIAFDLATANTEGSPVTSVVGEAGVTYTVTGIDPVEHDLLATTGEGFMYGKLFVCADSTVASIDPESLQPVDCDSTEVRVTKAIVAGNQASFSADGTDVVMRRVAAMEMGCVSCHAQQPDFSSAHLGTRGDETYPPNSACGACHAGTPNTAVTLTDGSCVNCHNPEGSAHANKPFERGFDFKVMIHQIHAGTRSERRTTDLAITYPNSPANCVTCHEAGQLDLGALTAVPAFLASDGAGALIEYSPTVAACAACHAVTEDANPAAVAHFRGNGGVYGGTRGQYEAEGNNESCAVCHSAGKSLGYDAVHGLQ